MNSVKIKKLAAVIAVIAVASAFPGCSNKENNSAAESTVSDSSAVNSSASDIDVSIAAEDIDVGYDEENTISVAFADGGVKIGGEGASAEGETVTISKAGTYILSGTADNGRIIVDADKNSEVKLVFNGVNITCSDNAPIYISKAKKVYMTLNDGTENTLTDSKSYSLGEEDSNVDGCIFSKTDLTINGSGTLNVTANYKHGIVSKDDLVITDGTLNVTAASTAVEGKDSVKISGGKFTLSAGSNGIKSTNTEDTGKGFISITGGTFSIVSNNDAIEAETVLTVEGGSFDITTGGGSANASMKSDGTPNGDWRTDMGNGGGGPGGKMMRPDNGEMPPDMPDNANGTTLQNTAAIETVSDESDETSTSAKALKSGSEIKISGGEFKIDSADDSLHCNGNIAISGGKISASSGDDGIHADNNLTVSDGTINIEKSYEGMEGAVVTIDGGTLNVTSSDDGINCSGGSDTGSADRAGADQFAAQDGVSLNINGGTVTVNAEGDGLDSNGNLYMNGGTVYVNGPTNGGNGALDYNGEAKVTGGTLIACGSSGMAEGFGESSTQNSVCHTLSASVSANEALKITDSSGKEVLTFTPVKNWQNVVFTSPDLKQGETYTITAGSVSEQVTLESIVTSNSAGGDFGGRGGKRF